MSKKKTFECDIFDFTNKSENIETIVKYIFIRLQSMFKWEGLPETIPQKYLEYYLQTKGHCIITEIDEKLYALQGGFSGVQDEYYFPTEYTVSNPYLNIGKTFSIKNGECVLCGNDSYFIGLYKLVQKYATLLTENELSIYIADINSRIISLLSADDDKTKVSAELFLENIKNGKLGVIGSNAIFEGIKSQPMASNNHNTIPSLIELEQYLKASLFNELGLQANWNAKRESVNSSEGELNEDTLFPLIDDMLKVRRELCTALNERYNLSVSVDLYSSWKDNRKEVEIELENLETEEDEGGGKIENTIED